MAGDVPTFYSLSEVEEYIADNPTLVFGEIRVRGVYMMESIRMVKLLEEKEERDEWDVKNIIRVRDVASFAYFVGNFKEVISRTCSRLNDYVGGVTAAAARAMTEQSPVFRKLVIGDSALLMFLGFADALIRLGEEMTLVAEDEEDESGGDEEEGESGGDEEEDESGGEEDEGESGGEEEDKIAQGRLLLPRLNQIRDDLFYLDELNVNFDTLPDGPAVHYKYFDRYELYPIAPEPVTPAPSAPTVESLATQDNLTLAAAVPAGLASSRDEDKASAPRTTQEKLALPDDAPPGPAGSTGEEDATAALPTTQAVSVLAAESTEEPADG